MKSRPILPLGRRNVFLKHCFVATTLFHHVRLRLPAAPNYFWLDFGFRSGMSFYMIGRLVQLVGLVVTNPNLAMARVESIFIYLLTKHEEKKLYLKLTA